MHACIIIYSMYNLTMNNACLKSWINTSPNRLLHTVTGACKYCVIIIYLYIIYYNMFLLF